MMKKRKLISMLLTVSMLMTLFPFSAFATEATPVAAPQAEAGQTATAPTVVYVDAAAVAEGADGTAEKPFKTLQAAISATTNGTIVLQSDISEVWNQPIDGAKDVTIDLNQKTLTSTAKECVEIKGGAKLTLKNGKVVNNSFSDGTKSFINVLTNSSVLIDGVTINTNGTALFPQGDAASVTVLNSEITAGVYAVGTNAATTDNYNVVITLKDSKFNTTGYQNNDGDNCTVMINVPGTLNVDNCDIIGDRQAVLVRAGKADIKNSRIILTGNYKDTANKYFDGAWGSGNEVPMAAVVVGDTSVGSYNAPADLTVAGTTVTAANTNKPAMFVSADLGAKDSACNTVVNLNQGTTLTGDVVTANGTTGQTSSAVNVNAGAKVEGDITANAANGSVALDRATVTGKIVKDEKSASTVAIAHSNVGSVAEGNDFTIVDSTVNNQKVDTNKAAMIGTVGYDSLDAAINAAKNNDVVVVLKNATVANAQFVIDGNKHITIAKAAGATVMPKIEMTVASGVDTKAIAVKPGSGLILDGVDLIINGTKNSNPEKGNDGTGIDLYGTIKDTEKGAVMTLKNGAIVTLQNLESATIASADGASKETPTKNQSVLTLEPGTQFNIKNIDGNAANGGNWNVDGATLTLDNCGSFGLSAHKLTVTNKGSVDVKNAAIAGVTVKDLAVENGSSVVVNNSGNKLPFTSTWNNKTTETVVVIQDNGSVKVDQTSSLELTNNVGKDNKPVNTVAPGNGTMSLEGTFIGEVVAPKAENEYLIQYMVNGKVYYAVTAQKAADGMVSYTAPQNPAVSGFTGWDYGKVAVTVTTGSKASFQPIDKQNTYVFNAKITPAKGSYKITAAVGAHGTITAYPNTAVEGSTVTFTVVPDKGYMVDTVVADPTSGANIAPDYIGSNQYRFTMPASAVTLRVTFKVAPAEHEVYVQKTSHGKVLIADADKYAKKGEWIDFTVKADKGYVLDTLTVTDANGDRVTVIDKGNGKYRFTMPDSAVSIRATFKPEKGQAPVEMPFIDIGVNAWYYDAVEYVYANGMMAGMTDKIFAPNTTLSRAMLAQVLYNLEGKPAAVGSAFTDVKRGDWYANAVNWAASKNIVAGMGDGTFAPNAPLTREQMAAILYRYADYCNYDTNVSGNIDRFSDAASVSAWARGSMSWAVGSGIISGMGNNTLAPQGTATRAQVATVLMNFCENVAL